MFIICIAHFGDSRQSILPTSDLRIRKGRIHLSSEPCDVAVRLLPIPTTTRVQTEDGAFHFNLNLLAPQRPVCLR